MQARLGDLRNKEVISVKDGGRIGYICDGEVDTETARMTAVVIYGRLRLFGLLGREKDVVIPWKDIAVIGEDTVLVHFAGGPPEPKNFLSKFLDKICF